MSDKALKLTAKNERQREYIRAIKNNEIVLCKGPAGTGKAQPIDSIVWTPTGPKLMGDIKCGDYVLTPYSTSAIVKGVYPQGKKHVFKITFSDNTSAECCLDHLWEIKSELWKNSRILSLYDIIRRGIKSNSGKRRYYIDLIAPAEFLAQEPE